MPGGSEKGWVREALVLQLSSSPQRPSDLAKKLKVSRPTVSYHLKELTRRGIVEIIDVRRLKGSVSEKTYGLTKGGMTVAVKRSQVPALGDHLERMEQLKMNWPSLTSEQRVTEVELLLYALFVYSNGEPSAPQSEEFETYGKRTGSELFAPDVTGSTGAKVLGSAVKLLATAGFANCSLETKVDGRSEVMRCLKCFGSREYGGPVCHFTRGAIAGILEARTKGHEVTLKSDPRLGCTLELVHQKLNRGK